MHGFVVQALTCFLFAYQRLNELVKVTKDHNDLDKDEVNIISGVLEMRKKTVGDIMTPIEDAYMLPIDSILDFETISKIMNSGELFTRSNDCKLS